MKLTWWYLLFIYFFLNTSVWANNPFKPPKEIQEFYQLIYPNSGTALPEYKMFILRDGKPFGLLNDKLVSENDFYEQMQITKITPKVILLMTKHGDLERIVMAGVKKPKQTD